VRRALAVFLVVLLAACSGDDDEAPPDDATATSISADDDLGDGTHFGFVTALEPARSRLEFDGAELLEGDDAVAAADADGGALTEGGSYVRNPDDRTSGITISDAVVVRLIADQCCELEEVAFEDWLAGFEPTERQFYGTASSHYEITIDDGEVVAVDEVVVP
jgi:hypothetical protein